MYNMKTKNHFFIPYVGNKREEYIYIKNLLPLSNKHIKNIIEPFAGSCAISYSIWKDYGNKFNYYLNDKDENLFNIYNLIKNEEIETIEENINKIKEECYDKETYEFRFKNQRNIYDYIYFHRYFNIRYGRYDDKRCGHNKPFKITEECTKFFEFLKSPNVFISNKDGIEIFQEHSNNKNNILILDPPYLAECNDLYNNRDLGIYEYLNNLKLKDHKANIFIWINDNWIVRLIFKKWFFLTYYPKIYGISKKYVNHIIISNKNYCANDAILSSNA